MIRPICVKPTSFTGLVTTTTTTKDPASFRLQDIAKLNKVLSLKPNDVTKAHRHYEEGINVGYRISTKTAIITAIGHNIVEIQEAIPCHCNINTHRTSICSITRHLLKDDFLMDQVFKHIYNLYAAKTPWYKRLF